MIRRLLADENFHGAIVRQLVRKVDGITVVLVQDTEIAGHGDAEVLAYAADHDFVTLTHDVQTMTAHAYERVAAGRPMPGLIEVSENTPIGQALEEIQPVCLTHEPAEIADRVLYVPM